MQHRKLTMPKICGPNGFVKIKRAQSRFPDMVAQKSNQKSNHIRDKSNRVSRIDTSRFTHKTPARCALNVKRNVTTLRSRTLLPCRKLQVSTDSQSTEYRSKLASPSSVTFVTNTPGRQLRLCKALHVQNTAIDSHQVAIEVHRQKKIKRYATVDSGASSHFYPSDYTGANHDPTAAPILSLIHISEPTRLV